MALLKEECGVFGIFNNKDNPAETTTASGSQDLDTKNELDALKEEMQQALKG